MNVTQSYYRSNEVFKKQIPVITLAQKKELFDKNIIFKFRAFKS